MIGVALAAFYAIRLYQRTMHNRLPEGVESREISLREALVLVPLVACIVALALYPGLILRGRRGRRCARRPLRAPAATASRAYAMTFTAPDIDYAGLSPRHRADRRALRRAARRRWSAASRWMPSLLSLADARRRGGALHLAVGREQGPRRGRAAARRPRARRVADRDRAAAFVVPLTLREPAAERAGHGDFQALILGSVLGMVLLAQAQNLISSSSRSSCSRSRSTCSAARRSRAASRSSRASST